MSKILVIEDDKLLNEALCIALKKEGYEALPADTCRVARSLLMQNPDLMIVDINLPDGDGISFCRRVGEEHRVPAIFLTARDEEQDMVEAFNAGADDYVVKPFQMKVLLKRIEAVLRRSQKEETEFSYKGLVIQFASKKVSVNEREISLTPKEYQLLELFVRHQGQVLTKENILEQVWDVDGMFVGENTVSVTVNRLRKKIESDAANPVYIKNKFGLGYLFDKQ